MTGPATAALSAAHTEITELRQQYEEACGRRDFDQQAHLRAAIARVGDTLEPLVAAAAGEQESARAAAWNAQEDAVLDTVHDTDAQLHAARDTAARALAELVEVTENRARVINAHADDPTRPRAGYNPTWNRNQHLIIGRERLVEASAADVALALIADVLGSRVPTEVAHQINPIRARMQLPPLPASATSGVGR